MSDTNPTRQRVDYLPHFLWVLAPLCIAALLVLSGIAGKPFLTHDWWFLQKGIKDVAAFCAITIPFVWAALVLWRVKFQPSMVWHAFYTLCLAGFLAAFWILGFVFSLFDPKFEFRYSLVSENGSVVLDVYQGKPILDVCTTPVRISDSFWPVTRHWATLYRTCPADIRLRVQGDRVELLKADGILLAHSQRGERAAIVQGN